MSLVTAVELGVSFGGKPVFEDASFAIQPADRIGLIGPNGSGKTTLLRLIVGEREPDEGEVMVARGVRVGYLPQDILELPQGSLVESVRSAVGDKQRIDAALAAVEEELPRAENDDERVELAQRLADLQAEHDHFEERYGRHRAEAILSGLGFAEALFDAPVSTLSGGWKMRAALASLLLEPDVLLLDEPTNHLDVPSLEWFDDFLRRSPRALVLISHDRQFLNGQIKRVLTLETEGLRAYPGDYDAYKKQRAEEEEDLEIRAARQAAQRAETMRFVERFRYKKTKARQAQSRLKRLEKEVIIQTRDARKTVRFKFPGVQRSGRDVLELEGVEKRFGATIVHRGLSAKVARGERIAIIGVNGAGKSTLLKMIAGELQPDAGTIKLGANVSPAYFAQHHTELLDAKNTVLEQIWSLVPREPQTHVRAVLGSFLFSGDDVDKKIGVLSGGERARVALARLLVVPSNLMLMDEPTNHLDVASAEQLAAALAGYEGTLVFVSHNKSFVNQLATRIWDLEGGVLEEWTGNLDAYLGHLKLVGKTMGAGAGVRQAAPPAKLENDRERRQREAAAREAVGHKLKPIKAEIARLEQEIDALEQEKRQLAPHIEDPALYDDFERARPLLARWEELGKTLEKLVARWEEQQTLLAAASS